MSVSASSLKVLVTGTSGQLGSAFQKFLRGKSNNFTFTNSSELNICSSIDLFQKIRKISPSVIINCAAYTAVDLAESEKAKALAINATAVKTLAGICADQNILLVHFSTDYVFDGVKRSPYLETDRTNPINEYGRTKMLGEQFIFASRARAAIIRISWLYSNVGNNFVNTMLKLFSTKREVRVVADRCGSPTFADDLAAVVLNGLPIFNGLTEPELFHFCNLGQVSRYEFANAILKLSKLDCTVLPISGLELPRPATRPIYSALDTRKISSFLNAKIPPWEASLKRFFCTL